MLLPDLLLTLKNLSSIRSFPDPVIEIISFIETESQFVVVISVAIPVLAVDVIWFSKVSLSKLGDIILVS